ncbi:hypothetical protein HID58_059905, partial [Brassica napus]
MNSRSSLGTSLAGFNARMPPKKPTVGQKKPLETLGSSPPPPSKKKKVVQNSMDQSIEQLNDVTAVSGVNLRVSFVFPDSFSFHFKSGCVVLNFAVCIDFFFF